MASKGLVCHPLELNCQAAKMPKTTIADVHLNAMVVVGRQGDLYAFPRHTITR